MTPELRNALDELLGPVAAERRDWAEVERRARALRSSRHRRYSVLVLAVITLALFATPAFGLRDAVLGLIGREDVEFEEGTPAPDVVRREFEDLGLGAPPGMDPQAVPQQTRLVGTFTLRGKPRKLWVAPTRRGGFCYLLAGASGGCLRNEPLPRGRVAVTYSASAKPEEPVEAGPLQGWVLDDAAARIVIEFEDGRSVDVPFTYVSAPIDAGFFAYDLPAANRREPHRPKSVAVFDADDDEIARETIRYGTIAPPQPAYVPPQKLSSKPPVPPSPPLQRATFRGVTVTAGANGVVIFDASRADRRIRALLDNARASYVCFGFRGGETRGYGISGGYQPVVGLRYHGLDTPFAGCEIQGTYGHRWPDRNDSHSAVEIAFTPATRRYYEDRAAARDVALFVRMRKVQELRKLSGGELVRALEGEFGSAIDRLDRRGAKPRPGRIGYWVGADRTLFRRVSTTGRIFEIEVRDGKVVRNNLGELAMVL